MDYPDESDLAYWTRRAVVERALADGASSQVRAIHCDLADRYEILVGQATGEQRREA